MDLEEMDLEVNTQEWCFEDGSKPDYIRVDLRQIADEFSFGEPEWRVYIDAAESPEMLIFDDADIIKALSEEFLGEFKLDFSQSDGSSGFWGVVKEINKLA